jgi:hypothetical protein
VITVMVSGASRPSRAFQLRHLSWEADPRTGIATYLALCARF